MSNILIAQCDVHYIQEKVLTFCPHTGVRVCKRAEHLHAWCFSFCLKLQVIC